MKKVRIGVFGAGRFPQLYESFTLAGADVVALCDFNEASHGRAPTVPCCSNPSYAPTEEQMRLYRELVLGKNDDT